MCIINLLTVASQLHNYMADDEPKFEKMFVYCIFSNKYYIYIRHIRAYYICWRKPNARCCYEAPVRPTVCYQKFQLVVLVLLLRFLTVCCGFARCQRVALYYLFKLNIIIITPTGPNATVVVQSLRASFRPFCTKSVLKKLHKCRM